MKHFALLILIIASVPCFASSQNIRIGDSVKYDLTSLANPALTYPVKWSVTAYDQKTGAYTAKLESETNIFPVLSMKISKDDAERLGSTKSTYRNCEKLGGTKEILNYDLGGLDVCHLPKETLGGERWVANDIRCNYAKYTIQDSSNNAYLMSVKNFSCH
jgi:putative hemolysin